MAKKKAKDTKNNDVKIKIWKILNIVLIMAAVVFFAVDFARSGVNNVWWNYTGHESGELSKELINDVLKMMTEYSLITVGVYAVLQVYYYVLYTFKLKKIMWISVLLSVIILATGLIVDIDLYAIVFPIASVLIYTRLLKLEEV
jgi:hypothetical protein